MLKYLLRKLLGSLLHSKRRPYRRHSSSYHNVYPNRRHSSSDNYSSYGHQQGQRYYKNRHHSSS
ncbi:hypothetical protein LOZ80_19015 [Paenibacillus sp. HWE-109]|uniref:hypothetical protein n=1 Tax=Paenibacillus sp. HWE-109 TaxID=1306526 RepID=UPI001EDF7A61|nr:hypothetical protein [Paenibacillus sp. HWE-109]UKS30914.1 hypothetical protein LOZ80_19015 [Paenibacillus sp. HWE-109]